MTRKASIVSLACALFAVLAVPVAAHHSVSAEFDTSQPITFTGTIEKVEWKNPHIYTHVAVKQPDGTTVVYHVEGGPPNSLFRQGWRKDTLKAGQVVKVSGVRAKRSDSMNIGVATITTEDGQAVFGRGGNNARREAPGPQ